MSEKNSDICNGCPLCSGKCTLWDAGGPDAVVACEYCLATWHLDSKDDWLIDELLQTP